MKLIISIFFLKTFLSVHYCLSKNENEMTQSLINNFGVKHCIIVGDRIEDIKAAANLKFLATRKIYSIFMNEESFTRYFRRGRYLNMKTAVIIETNAMINIFTILKKYYRPTEPLSDFFLSSFTWILFVKPFSAFEFEIKNYYIPYNCELFIIRPINDTHYKVIETYNIGLKSNSTRKTGILGFWSNQALWVAIKTKEKRRFNMFGETVLFLAPPKENFFKIDHIQDNCLTSKHPDCFGIIIVKSIAEMMNATPIFHSSREFEKWQFESTVMSMEPLRIYHLNEWLGPLYFDQGYFFIKDNIDEEYRMSAYSAPFSKSVWKYILVSFLLTSCTSIIIELMKRDSINSSLFIRAAFEPFDTFCNQCGSEIIKNSPTRLVWLSIQISASVLVPLYMGFIVSYLTISAPKLPFTDLETFIQDGTYKASGIKRTLSQYHLEESLEKIRHGEGLKLLLNNTPQGESDARNWILNSDFKYAFAWYFHEFAVGYNIRRIPKPIFSFGTGIRMRRDSPFVKIYKINFHLFNTNGMVHKMRDIYDESDKMYVMQFESTEETFIPITIKHIMLVLYIIIIGQVIALTLLIIKLLWKKLKIPNQSSQGPTSTNSELFHRNNRRHSHRSDNVFVSSIE